MDGQCLCGAITVHAPDKHHIESCHCGMCRRWGGGPALGVACGTDVQITGVDQLKVYQSSDWAERSFCGECGTHIFYRLLATGDYFVPVGLFQDGIEFEVVPLCKGQRKIALFWKGSVSKTLEMPDYSSSFT
jgi:hypothetical protein